MGHRGGRRRRLWFAAIFVIVCAFAYTQRQRFFADEAGAGSRSTAPSAAVAKGSPAPSPQVVSVRDWATIVKQDPDGHEVNDVGVRKRITDTGYPWLVRHEESEIEFVLIPPGEYLRGASPGDTEAEPDEKPAHIIVIEKPFYLARTEVTNRQYRTKVPGHDSGQFEDKDLNQDEQPAVMIRWTAADEFSRKLGPGFRLPEEWEWEYARRAGTTDAFPWGNSAVRGRDRNGRGPANVFDAASGRNFAAKGAVDWDDGFVVSAPVESFPPNGFGLRDMIGNVVEWCATAYERDEYRRAAGGRPLSPTSPPTLAPTWHRAARGGSWCFEPKYCRSSYRHRLDSSQAFVSVGFRPMRMLP